MYGFKVHHYLLHVKSLVKGSCFKFLAVAPYRRRFDLRLRLDKPWNDAYADHSSTLYKRLKAKLEYAVSPYLTTHTER